MKFYIIFIIYATLFKELNTQHTILDDLFLDQSRLINKFLFNVLGRTGENQNVHNILKQQNRMQNFDDSELPLSDCNCENGFGSRSQELPTSVHRLRPGDIDIIGALGDSLTAGWGIFALNRIQTILPNRGASFSIGGQGNMEQFITLPNILKKFNSNLYGYSLGDSLTIERTSKFNVAEAGAMSKDIPYMAQILVKRLQRDSLVNMTHHWKLVTIFIGNNDFCGDICYHPNFIQALNEHERNMVKAYRYLRDNVPKLLLIVIPPPNTIFLTKYRGLGSKVCLLYLQFLCPCLLNKTPKELSDMNEIMNAWIERDQQIVQRDEFNTETFTINAIMIFKNFVFPTKSNGDTDFTYTSPDCFHVSQKSHAAAAMSLWNNLFCTLEEQTSLRLDEHKGLYCPTAERPYFVTRVNKGVTNF